MPAQISHSLLGAVLLVFCLAQNLAAADRLANAAPDERVARIPTKAFAAHPFLSRLELSPTGDRVVAAVRDGERSLLGIVFLGQETDPARRGLRKISFGDGKLRWFRWLTNDQVLVSVLQENRRAYYSRLYIYDVISGELRYVGAKNQGLVGDDVLFIAKDGSYLLLSIAPTPWQYPMVYRVDLASGEMTKLVDSQRPIFDWYADNQGVVRLGLGYRGRKTHVVYRDSAEEEFRTVAKLSWDDDDSEVETLRFRTGGNGGFAVTNAKNGRFGLYEFDWDSLEIGKPIFEHPEVDIDDYWLGPDGDLSAVIYTDDRRRVHWLDESMKELQAEIDGALANRSNWVSSRNRDQTRFIIWSASASDPGHYFFYDRNAGVITRLATPIEDLLGQPLAEVKAVQYQARDGLTIHGYLTLPRKRDPHALPLIVLPHGGPHVRDDWSYDPTVQFLANLGYAVLQPNFRGSSGYGKAFLERGYGQWGGAMQQDLDDGVQWLAEQGTVDPKRVCMMGISYGGYAALIAAINSPQTYRCAISFAGVTDVDAWMRSHRYDMLPARYKKWRQRVHGDEAEHSEAPSPLDLADQVAIPVLIGHGTDDNRVPFKQAEKMAKAMRKAQKDVEFLSFKDAGHGYEDEDLVRFFDAVEAFLQKHNPAYQTAPDR